ncbi:MAG: hypothetical protein ACI8RZ_001480 [Myxococcota bacterium]|jgi:hypothetical protein
MANTALSQVMNGAKDIKSLTENQAKSALAQATGKIGKVNKAAAKLKENGGAAVSMALHTGETVGTTFMASMAEGFAISKGKSLKVGPVDLRVIGSVPLIGWGFIDCLRGKGGGHQLAIGTGLLCSATASLGLQAGQALAEKRDASANGKADTPAAEPTAPHQLTAEDDLTIALTPTTAGAREIHLDGQRGRKNRKGRKLANG